MNRRWVSILVTGVFLALVLWLVTWAHHMFVTGLNPFLGSIFLLLAILLAIPPAIWGIRKLQRPVWELFTIGALCGVIWAILEYMFVGRSTLDIHLNDTYFVISAFHRMTLLPVIMIVYAGVYYWLEKGDHVNTVIGRFHFWITLLGLWYLLWPGSYTGLAAMPRRYIDLSGSFYDPDGFGYVHRTMAMVMLAVELMQLVFAGMVIYALVRKKR